VLVARLADVFFTDLVFYAKSELCIADEVLGIPQARRVAIIDLQ
jgi:hypothetical protein